MKTLLLLLFIPFALSSCVSTSGPGGVNYTIDPETVARASGIVSSYALDRLERRLSEGEVISEK